ncbi:MAG: hypothetical protein AAGE86_04250 [Pseudomonadota bacterium]
MYHTADGESEMYRIQGIAPKHRVLVSFHGDFDFDQSDLDNELKSIAMDVRSAEGHFDLLADFTQAPVMPQDRAQQSEVLIAWCVANGLRKSANVMDTTIQAIQVKRVSAHDEKFRTFTSRREAELWLDS